MLAPQSASEIQPVVRALQGMDGLLDIRWEPNAILVAPGHYSVTGTMTPATYAGRWQCIRYETENAHPDRRYNGRTYAVICMITKPVEVGGLQCLQDGGEYVPIGPWFVTFMQSADAANTRMMEDLRTKLWSQDEVIETAHDCEADAMARESLDSVHFHGVYAGGVGNWQGRGADFAPETSTEEE